jgi:ATP-binding cassette, subfamily B, bacterial PglK
MSIFRLFKLVFDLLENRKTIPFLIFLFLFNSIVEVAGISAIAWFLVLATEPVKSNSEVYQFFSNWLNVDETSIIMLTMATFLIVAIILKSSLSLFTNRFIYHYSFNQGALIRARLLSKYLDLPYEEWSSKSMSEYIQSVVNLPVQYSQNILLSVVRIFSEGIVFIAISIFIITVDSLAFFMFGLIIFILYWLFNFFFKKRSAFYGKKINDDSREMISIISESLTGFAEIRLKNTGDFFISRLLRFAKDFSSNAAKFEIINTIPRYLIEISILLFLILYLLSFSFYGFRPIDEALFTLGILGAASIRIAPSANLILSAVNQIRFGRDTLLILKDALLVPKGYESVAYSNIDIKSNIESLEIKSLTFAYAGDNTNLIFKNISLNFFSGTVIGIKGRTGSGKSTFLALILGLLKPSSGSVKFNYDSKSFLTSDCIVPASYIPQKPFIINDNVQNNIALGEIESVVNKDQIHEALKKAKLDSEISEDRTELLGDGGNTLSGGQRQRLSIARAFYENNKFIVLDEPTSALDEETRDYVVKQIHNLKEGRIIVMVSHDPDILFLCDEVYEVKSGKILKLNKK